MREGLWERIVAFAKTGRAIMVYSARNEQHLQFKVLQPDWEPVDVDGLELIKRPRGAETSTLVPAPDEGWSNASKWRRARRFGR